MAKWIPAGPAGQRLNPLQMPLKGFGYSKHKQFQSFVESTQAVSSAELMAASMWP